LSRELNLKYEECDTINEELRLAYDAIRNSEMEAQNMLRGKEDEVFSLTNKINEMEIILSKYGQNLINIKKAYEKINNDHQIEIMKKNNEIKQIRESYEKRIKELQNKIEDVLLKENVFTHKLNNRVDNSHNNFNALNSLSNNNVVNRVPKTSNPYVYVPKEIPDDEDVRRNINEQINFIKEKLDRSYYHHN
jgi:Cu/Ag efflux pump CusA